MVYAVLDIGNTLTKAGWFDEQGTLTDHQQWPTTLSDESSEGNLSPLAKASHVLISSVVDPLPNYLMGGWSNDWILLDEHTTLPITIEYENPEKLGKDRMANAAAAHGLFPGSDVLIIDAGTCVTYDVLRHDGTFLGGAISPGLEMRYKALHTFTSQLPLVESVSAVEKNIGKSTKQSITQGVHMGLLDEMNGFIARYAGTTHPRVVLTGGDAPVLQGSLNCDTFADPFFGLKGLYFILKHHVG